MGRNVLLGCLTCPCFSSGTHDQPPSSSEKVYASTTSPDTTSSADSPDLSSRIQEVLPYKLVPLPRQRAYPDLAVGIDDQVNFVIRLLEWENETNVAVAVILHGLGGTGKTTLADAVVATLDIQGWNCFTVVPFQSMRNLEDGQGEIQDLFKKERAFIYIDNVMVRGEHFQNLLPKYCKKLRLLLTARDEMVADAISGCGIHTHIYPVRPLHSHDAIELLCSKMGLVGSTQIPHHHISQINEIVKICDGVPLVLERVGAYICQSLDKDEAYRRVIEWSKDGKPFSSAEEYIIEKNGLLFDLEELPASAKEHFLDICSFFNGWEWDKVSCIIGEDELNSLSKSALLLKKEEYENKVMVRPIILTVGRNMTKGKRFTSAHDLSKALEGNDLDEIGGIKGIWLQDNISEPLLISAKELDLMHDSLRVLALGNLAMVVDGQCTQNFKQMIYFHAGLIPCIPFHPTTLQELRFLECRLPHDSNGVQLTEISSKLKRLNLNGGQYVGGFEIASSFWRLRGLRALKLTDFKSLENLPEELRLLTQLEDLDVSGCEMLVQLPKGLGSLNVLTKLSLRYCGSLQELPDWFGKLRSLKYLDFQYCRSLQQLPEDFGSLSSLEELDLGHCSSLKELPSSFAKLSSLKVLTLVGCTSLNYLRDDIRDLSALVRIEFEDRRLVSIPCRYIKLVKNLSSEWCEQLTNLPKQLIELTNLRSLDLYRWSSLTRLPEGFGQLKSLAELNIQFCESLQELSSDFHCLGSLQTLNLEWCKKLEGKWMDSVARIKTLELVSIGGSPKLVRRWAEMAKEGKSWWFAVTDHDEDRSWNNVENVLTKAASKLFTGESLLTDFRGEPFSLTTVPPNTLLIVLYPCRPHALGNYLSEYKLLEDVVKHEHPPPFQIISAGRYSRDLPKSFAERILAYTSVDSDAHFFFKKVFNAKVAFSLSSPQFLVTEVVADEEGRKHFSTWENIMYSREEFLLSKSRLYSHLQKLTGIPQDSNVKLLRELFDTAESRTSSIFLRNYTENIGVDQLHGKTVLLLISVIDKDSDMADEGLLQSLKEIYSKAKTNDDMEILSIPIPADVRGCDLAGFERILRNVPWPVLRNPWLLKKQVYYFFEKEWGKGNSAILVVVDPNGRIRNQNALLLVKRWGAEVYPFTDEKLTELKQRPTQRPSKAGVYGPLEMWRW